MGVVVPLQQMLRGRRQNTMRMMMMSMSTMMTNDNNDSEEVSNIDNNKKCYKIGGKNKMNQYNSTTINNK